MFRETNSLYVLLLLGCLLCLLIACGPSQALPTPTPSGSPSPTSIKPSVLTWRSETATIPFEWPALVYVDRANTVYINDYAFTTDSIRVFRFDAHGKRLPTWVSSAGPDFHIVRPYEFAMDATGTLFVADWAHSRIQKFAPDQTFLATWGGGGYQPGLFAGLTSLTVAQSGLVYAYDLGCGCVQQFDATGHYLKSMYRDGDPNKTFYSATITLDAHDVLYLLENGSGQVHRFSAQGQLLASWNGLQHPVTASPAALGIAVDRNDQVYITDTGGDRILLFDLTGRLLTTRA